MKIRPQFVLGWYCLLSWFAAIWLPEYRTPLFVSGTFTMILAIILQVGEDYQDRTSNQTANLEVK